MPMSQSMALTLLRIGVGLFLAVKGLGKVHWLADSTALSARLTAWSIAADPISATYAGALLAGAPVFARLVVFGELAGGVALMVGWRTRVVAGLALLMILNFHLASGSLTSLDFFRDASALPFVTSLATLVVGAGASPLRSARSRR